MLPFVSTVLLYSNSESLPFSAWLVVGCVFVGTVLLHSDSGSLPFSALLCVCWNSLSLFWQQVFAFQRLAGGGLYVCGQSFFFTGSLYLSALVGCVFVGTVLLHSDSESSPFSSCLVVGCVFVGTVLLHSDSESFPFSACLVVSCVFVGSPSSFCQPWCNPLWLTGLMAPTN